MGLKTGVGLHITLPSVQTLRPVIPGHWGCLCDVVMGLVRFMRIVSLSKYVLTQATGRHTPPVRCCEPIFCAHTTRGCFRNQTCPLFTILFYLPLSTHLSLSIAAVSASLLTCPPPNPQTHLFSLSTNLSLSIYPPFHCLPSLSLYLPPLPASLLLSGSPLSLFFFLTVTTFPGLIANLSAGKCFVTSR